MTREELQELQKSSLSIEEIAAVLSLIGVFAHAAERFMNVLDSDLKLKFMQSKQYMLLTCKHGKEKAREILDIGGDAVSYKRSTLGSILNSIDAIKAKMEKETLSLMKSSTDDECTAFDNLQNDVQWLTRFYAIASNCSEDYLIRLESFAKSLAKNRNKVSDKIYSRL